MAHCSYNAYDERNAVTYLTNNPAERGAVTGAGSVAVEADEEAGERCDAGAGAKSMSAVRR